jgi:hypothetical protein
MSFLCPGDSLLTVKRLKESEFSEKGERHHGTEVCEGERYH